MTEMDMLMPNTTELNTLTQDLQQSSPIASGTDLNKLFSLEVENLELITHEWVLENIEDRILKLYKND